MRNRVTLKIVLDLEIENLAEIDFLSHARHLNDCLNTTKPQNEYFAVTTLDPVSKFITYFISMMS